MTQTQATVVEKTLRLSHEWLEQIEQELELPDQEQALSAFRAVVHTLRDRLTPDEAADLASQLPTLLRGFYYEQWKPSAAPRKQRDVQEFLGSIGEQLNPGIRIDPARCARGVFAVLERHVTGGEIEDVRNMLPADIRSLWPER